MNNMEQMGGFDERVMLGNQMQMELAEMHGEDLGDFIERHAEEFRNVVTQQPQLLQQYKNDPQGTLDAISKEIYH